MPYIIVINKVSMKINKLSNRNKYLNFGNTQKSFLEIVEVGISKNCNLRCGYCPNKFLKRNPTDEIMPNSLFKKILKNLQKINFEGILTFHRYNEPLLAKNPLVEDYIKIARKYLPKASAELSTNGSLLNVSRLKDLKTAGINKIIVTQHTPKGFLDKLDKIPDDLLENVYVRYGEELTLLNRAGIVNNIENTINQPCYYVNESIAINSNGIVSLCADDYYSKFKLGDLNKESIETIWYKPSVVKIREELNKGNRNFFISCQKCDRVAEKRQKGKDFSSYEALYRKKLLLDTGSAHLK